MAISIAMNQRKEGLTGEDCIEVIRKLSNAQGFYSRLYRDLMNIKDNDPDKYQDVLDEFASHHFSDNVDFILWIEG